MRTFWVAKSFAQGDRQEFEKGPKWQFPGEWMGLDGIVYEADAEGQTRPVVKEIVLNAAQMSKAMFEKISVEIEEMNLAYAIGRLSPAGQIVKSLLQQIYDAAPFAECSTNVQEPDPVARP